jgi:haloacetate dehalogenase
VPTLEQFERLNRASARQAYHWYFLVQPAAFPETLIGPDPAYFLTHTLESWCGTPGAFTPEALELFTRRFAIPR